MPLPAPTVARKPKHVRRISYEVYTREDGLWDIEAHLTDTKSEDATLLSGVRPAGEPMHDMWLRVVVNERLEVVEAVGVLDASPYPGTCERIGPDYGKLVGLNLMKGFRQAVKERMPNDARCTHVHELANHMPTVVVQSLWRELMKVDSERKPLPIDNCHTQRSDSEITRIQYPKWYRAPRAAAPDPQHPSEETYENP